VRSATPQPLAAILFVFAAIATPILAPAAPPPSSTASAPNTAPVVRADESLLYRIPSSVRIADTITSPDTRHVACVEERTIGGDRTYDITLDGVASPRVPWVVGQSLIFSPDSSRVSWQTQDASTTVVIDTVEHLLHAGAPGDPGPATVGTGYWMVGHVLFSKDGRHAAFPAQLDKSDKHWRMVLDGKAGNSFDELDDTQMLFSPDGGRLAYKAGQADPNRATAPHRQCFVVDDTPGPTYDGVVAPVFSDNGAHLGYVAKLKNEEFYVIDGKEQAHYELTAALSFAAGGRRYAYAAGKAGKQLLVVDGKAYKPFEGIGDLVFSPDGRRIALTAISGPKWTAVIDGKESGAYDGAGALHFSPDSKRVAFVAGRGKRQLVIADGTEGPLFDGVGSLTFSADSKQVGYLAIDGPSKLLVVNGQAAGPAGAYAFSPDGRHVARTVPHADGRWGLAIDGTEASAIYDGFPLGSRIAWDSPDTARTIAGRGNELIRVELHVQ
jgi:hypothetical protein